MGIFSAIKEMFGGGPKVDYAELINNGAIIVDVRTPGEFKSGHFKGSKNIPLQTFESNVKKMKDKEVILVCKSGGRASRAKMILSQKGITAHNAGAWQNLNNI